MPSASAASPNGATLAPRRTLYSSRNPLAPPCGPRPLRPAQIPFNADKQNLSPHVLQSVPSRHPSTLAPAAPFDVRRSTFDVRRSTFDVRFVARSPSPFVAPPLRLPRSPPSRFPGPPPVPGWLSR